MSIFFKFLLFLSFINTASAVSNYKGHSFSIQNAFDSHKAQLSNLEKKIAGNFHKLYKLSKVGVINRRLLASLLSDMKKSNTFYSYIVWPKTLLKIEDASTINSLHTLCNNISDSDDSSGVTQYLNKNAQKVCYKKLLKSLSDIYSEKGPLNKTNMKYFAANIGKFLDHSMETELKYFLSRFKPLSKGLNQFSKELTQYYIKYKKIPSKNLMPYMNVSIELTNYIQTIDLNRRSTEKIFLKSYQKLAKKSLKAADNSATQSAIKKNTQEIISFIESTSDKQNIERLFTSFISYGKSLSRRKQYDSARLVFSKILERKSSHYKKAIFELLWTYVSNKEYTKGLLAIENYTKEIDTTSDSKISFWIAHCYHHSGRKSEAEKVFKELITKNPLSYYAILSAKFISENIDGSDTKSIYLNYLSKNSEPQKINHKNFDHRWLKRIMAWGDVHNSRLLNLELADISKRKQGVQLETHLLSAAYQLSQEKNYLESFKVIYRHVDKGTLNVNTEVLKLLFPLPFLKEVIAKSKDFDPIIAMSLIRQESGFNRFAKSRVGARGLMQLMPGTARRFKRKVRTKQLYNTNLNITIGTKYFHKLLTMFDNNLVYSLSAYNAGENRVFDWQKRDYVNSKDSMLHNIENIPFLETRKYVKLIFRNVFFYKMLTEESIKKDTFKFNRIYDIHVGFKK